MTNDIVDASEIALKMAEDGTKMSEIFNMSLSNGKKGKFECLDARSDDTKRVMKFELMDNAELYNGVRFPMEALEHFVNVFNQNEFLVTHGMDHSGNVRDQLGKVIEAELVKNGDLGTVYIVSEHYKETPAQRDAETLFKQGLLDSISGGWRCGIAFNEETDEFEIYKPVLREVSSTPIPAKTSATVIENVCMALKNYSPKKMKTEEIIQHEIPDKEEFEMPENEKPTEPSAEGKMEQSAEFLALKAQADATAQKLAEMETSQESAVRASLMARAAELGLSEEDFKDMPNSTIEAALGVANKVQLSTLRGMTPDNPLGGEGNAGFTEDSPEMTQFLMDEVYRVTDFKEK